MDAWRTTSIVAFGLVVTALNRQPSFVPASAERVILQRVDKNDVWIVRSNGAPYRVENLAASLWTSTKASDSRIHRAGFSVSRRV